MGQAKQRGTRQERVEAAVERDRAVELAREGRRIELANRGLDRAIAGSGNKDRMVVAISGAGRPQWSGLASIALALAAGRGTGK